jgi:exodeoxyribonuclease-3
MKVATWNVNGIRARNEQFAQWVHDEQPDIVCLQEIKAKLSQIPQAICALEGYQCYWHGAGGYSGVALHVRQSAFSLPPQFSHPHFDHETRIVQAELGNTIFASVYVPNGGKDFQAKINFVKALIGYASEIHQAGRQLIISGDFNIARTDMDVHPKEQREVIGQLPEERELFEALIARDLVDLGRNLQPHNENYFTWWPPWRSMRERNIGWRLDYILASESIARTATSCLAYREIGTSDHAPVVAIFDN